MPADVNTGRLRADKNKVVTSIALYTSSSLRLVKWTVFFQLEVHPSAAVILDLRVMATNSEPQETPEYRTFRQYYDRLYNAIQDPLSLNTCDASIHWKVAKKYCVNNHILLICRWCDQGKENTTSKFKSSSIHASLWI